MCCSATLLAFLVELLKSSVAMQEQMLGGKGFLVIGYLLEKVHETPHLQYNHTTYNHTDAQRKGVRYGLRYFDMRYFLQLIKSLVYRMWKYHS